MLLFFLSAQLQVTDRCTLAIDAASHRLTEGMVVLPRSSIIPSSRCLTVCMSLRTVQQTILQNCKLSCMQEYVHACIKARTDSLKTYKTPNQANMYARQIVCLVPKHGVAVPLSGHSHTFVEANTEQLCRRGCSYQCMRMRILNIMITACLHVHSPCLHVHSPCLHVHSPCLHVHSPCLHVHSRILSAGNSFAGIGIKGKAKPLLDCLTIRENQGYGVLLQDTASSVMQNCVVEDNKKSGLCCTGHSVLRLSLCSVGYAPRASYASRTCVPRLRAACARHETCTCFRARTYILALSMNNMCATSDCVLLH